MSESDGMEETFEGQLRVGLLIAGRVAEEVARLREQVAREAEARSLQSAREQQERVAADRAMARAALGPVVRDSWWDRARPQDVAAAWQTVRTWEAVEPDARRAADTIRRQVRDRYRIDVDGLGDGSSGSGAAQIPALEPALRRVLEERVEAAEAGPESSAQRVRDDQERAVAVLLASESAEDRVLGDGAAVRAHAIAAVTAAGPAYDSHQRREAMAEDLTRTVDPQYAEAIEARLVADKASAGPVSDVVDWQSSGNAGTPRGAAVAGRGRQHAVER